MATALLRAIPNKLSTSLLVRRQPRFSFPFSSNANPKYSNYYLEDSQCGGSSVYKHKLQFQRPTTIQWKGWLYNSMGWLYNSVTFIGRVVFPPRTIKSEANFGVYTLLEVKSSRYTFRILLNMWDNMADISSQHLKEDDFIYVSGKLGSHIKVDENGHPKIFFKVNVKELNYVACGDCSPDNQKFEKTELKGRAISTSGASSVERTRDRLYLWQVFFASPHEWWDNRKNKKYPRAPDFKHKDTGECLWLDPKDPPWVRSQLQLQDDRKAELGYRGHQNYRSRVSMWMYDE